MKKLLSLVLCIVVLVSVFTVNVSAVDNYEPKVIEVQYDPITEKCYIPEGYVVYVGDTLKLNRADVSFMGDFADSKNGGEIEYGAVAILHAYDIMNEWGNKLGSVWGGGELYISEKLFPEGTGWKDSTIKPITTPGTYTLVAQKGRDMYWAKEYKLGKIEFLTFEVVDPAKVDEIVLPPEQPADDPVESTEEPVESTEEPVESTEEPVESVDEPVESIDEPTESIDEPTESIDEPTDVEPAGNGWVIWVIIGAVVVAAVVVVILVSKKKK